MSRQIVRKSEINNKLSRFHLKTKIHVISIYAHIGTKATILGGFVFQQPQWGICHIPIRTPLSLLVLYFGTKVP